MRSDQVIYVNFSQYDNTGRILDYLRESFPSVIHFSFDHLRLKNGRKTNVLTRYENGTAVYRNQLYSLRVPSLLLFPSLPLVGLLMMYQTVRHSMTASKTRPTIFFTVNAFPAVIGIFMKHLGLVSKVHFWVWDYFPPGYPNWKLRLARMAYLICDRIAVRYSDHLIFPNKRQLIIRYKDGKCPSDAKIIPLGSSGVYGGKFTRSNTCGFLGMLKENQGAYLLFYNLNKIFSLNPNLTIEIIGSGPEENLFRKLSEPYGKRIKFYGFMDNHDLIDKIVRRWFAGLAVYKPDSSNESLWGDPSKIKVYLSQGVPLITTAVTDFGLVCTKENIGLSIPYTAASLSRAIKLLHKKQVVYRRKARLYGNQFYYKKLYRPMFSDSSN